MPQIDARVAAIFRQDSPIIPEGNTVVEAGDEVFFIADTRNIRGVLRELRRMDKPVKRVMIGGGGNIGRRLAKQIEHRFDVKLIEYNKANAERLAAELDKTLVLHGDVTDEQLLAEENIGDMDVYCALTNDDENNIMSSLLAKRMGVRKVIALINRSSYVNLVQSGPDRHRDLAGAGDDRHAARARAARRLRRRALAAARRRRSARARGARRCAILESGRAAHRGARPAERRDDRRDRAPARARGRTP